MSLKQHLRCIGCEKITTSSNRRPALDNHLRYYLGTDPVSSVSSVICCTCYMNVYRSTEKENEPSCSSDQTSPCTGQSCMLGKRKSLLSENVRTNYTSPKENMLAPSTFHPSTQHSKSSAVNIRSRFSTTSGSPSCGSASCAARCP